MRGGAWGLGPPQITLAAGLWWSAHRDAVIHLLRVGQKHSAVEIYRAATGAHPVEAAQAVEQLERFR